MDTDQWWRDLAAFCRANPDFVPELDMSWDPGVKKEGDMAPNVRGPIYAAIQGPLGRYLTPDEKIKLDKLLDNFRMPAR